MPISFTEVAGAGDVLPNNRHLLSFPTLPGGSDGRILELRHTEVTLPQFQVGQVQARIFGHPVAFAGLRLLTNTFSAGFVDTTGSPLVKALVKWQNQCAGMLTHRAKLKAQYSVNAKCVAHDTTGTKSLHVNLLNVWPINITFGNFSEDSSPQHIEVEFSVDAMDIDDLQFNTDDFSTVGVSSSVENRPSINMGSFTVSQQVINKMGNVSSTGVVGLMSAFFG